MHHILKLNKYIYRIQKGFRVGLAEGVINSPRTEMGSKRMAERRGCFWQFKILNEVHSDPSLRER